MKYNFVEIGTSDFDTMIQKCGEDATGISVEPLKIYLNRLPEKPNVKKLNCAISNRKGKATVFFVSDENIRKYGLPAWVRGCNSIEKMHPTLNGEVEWLQDILKVCLRGTGKQIQDLVEQTEIDVITFSELIEACDITGIDYLKIDTEGHDIIILESYIECCEKYPELLAEIIQFETNELTPADAVDSMIKRLENVGYKLHGRGDSTIMILRAE